MHNKRGTNNKLFQILNKIIKIKSIANIKCLNVPNNDFLYTANADDTNIFHKMKNLQQKF